MRIWIRYCISLLMCLSFAATGQAATRIMFVGRTNGSEDTEIYSMNTDGSDLYQVTDNAISENRPVLSPDTNRIAYVYNGSIYLTTLAGAAPVQVTTSTNVYSVQWGDTNTLYYLRYRETFGYPSVGYYVWKVNLDGSGEAEVFSNPLGDYTLGGESFHLDQNNARIYVVSYDEMDMEPSLIYSGDITNTTLDAAHPVQSPLDGSSDHYNPAVSPDASLIAYIADYGGGGHALYVGTNGSSSAALQLQTNYCGSPSWSSDGSWLAFTWDAESTVGAAAYTGDICRVNVDGSMISNLTENLSVAGYCAFPTVYDGISDLDGDGISDEWERRYFGSTTSTNADWDYDYDDDGRINLDEFVAGTVPTNKSSILKINISISNGNIIVSYPTIGTSDSVYDGYTREYDLVTVTNMGDTWQGVVGETNVTGDDSVRIYTNSLTGNMNFFRIKTRLE